MTSELVSPRDIRLLADNVACLETIADARIEHGLNCPRCRSAKVHVAALRLSAVRINPQFRCVECGYIIAVTAGTFMMGARMMPKQYVQVFVLSNALADALPKTQASAAADIRSRDGLNNILDRLRLVDPGIRFAHIDPDRSAELRDQKRVTDKNDSEGFFGFCESRSIVIDPDAMNDALSVVFTMTVPELVESYKKRGRPYATRPKPMRTAPEMPKAAVKALPADAGVSRPDSIQGLRKALAQQWIARFAEALPQTSSKQRVALAWQLAALGVDSDRQLQSLDTSALMPPTLRKPVFIELRGDYLRSKRLA